MSQIKARCIEQVLMFENTPEISSGNVNYDSVKFDFCSSWTGFTKTAIFYRNEDEVYYQLLDDANTCIIPKEVLAERGVIYIGVFGVYGDKLLTSQVLSYRISQGAITENIKPADPTPDIYVQIISRYSDYDERLAYFEERFNGSVGDAEKLGGQLPSYYATAESVNNVVNGTTKVGKASEADNATNAGNANALGGHGAEYFAPLANIGYLQKLSVWDSAWTKIEQAKIGLYYLLNETITDLPSNVAEIKIVRMLLVMPYADQKSYILTEPYSNKIWLGKTYGGGLQWKELSSIDDFANYLPLTGGDINGSVTLIDRLGSNVRNLVTQNSIVGASIGVWDNGTIGMHDNTGADWIFYKGLGGTPVFNGTANGNLPLDGNTPLEGNTLGISQNRGSVNADDAHVGLKTHTTKGDTENYRYLMVLNASQYGSADVKNAIFLRDCVNGAQTNYTLHHDGNSAKVHIGTSAPSDTSALWIDTSA